MTNLEVKDIRLLADHIANQPLSKRRKMILKILRDLGKYIDKKEGKKPSYVV